MKTRIAFLGLWLLSSCTPRSGTDRMTALPFAVTGSTAAMPSFEKGLLLLHNFEYDDAAEAFIEAQKTDRSFVMAYWGEAMTYDHPVWGEVDLDKARATLEKLGPSPAIRVAKATTPLEADFLQAIEILYGQGSKPDRDKQYSDFMKTLFERYPGNHEVAAFYALSLLALKEGWNKWEEANIKGAEICEAILRENPVHPGALHYLIHSDDHPEHAQYALNAADDYARVASYAGHALHMPSHIYLALGRWADVVRSNEISWQAGVGRKERKNLTNDDLNYHAHIWLEYGYLQQGRYDAARERVENQLQYTTTLPSADGRFALQQMKGYYLFETGEWTGSVADIRVDVSDLALSVRTVGYLIDGAKAFYGKNEMAMRETITALEADLARATVLKNDNENISICGVQRLVDRIPSAYELRTAEFVGLELRGMLAWLKNDVGAAEKLLSEAVKKGGGYLYGPPNILKPSEELFGEFLLSANRPEEALSSFSLALKYSPNRLRSLNGGIQAARASNNIQKAKELQKRMDEIFEMTPAAGTGDAAALVK